MTRRCTDQQECPEQPLQSVRDCRKRRESLTLLALSRHCNLSQEEPRERTVHQGKQRVTEACHAQVRYDKRVGGDTAVKFMTDGILLRELQSDLLLRAYSVLILDEAHERSLNTDLLLGALTYCCVIHLSLTRPVSAPSTRTSAGMCRLTAVSVMCCS